jgi:hypothetical protein
MEPMKPMQPMKPMAPMSPMEKWWPAELGEPASQGSQDRFRYAVFPQRQRLLIEKGGEVTTYDSGDHKISGVSQENGDMDFPVFTSQNGTLSLSELKKID